MAPSQTAPNRWKAHHDDAQEQAVAMLAGEAGMGGRPAVRKAVDVSGAGVRLGVRTVAHTCGGAHHEYVEDIGSRWTCSRPPSIASSLCTVHLGAYDVHGNK